jgi:hypothetical protein
MIAQESPSHSWNLIGPAVVSASKSGAMLPRRRVGMLSRLSGGQKLELYLLHHAFIYDESAEGPSSIVKLVEYGAIVTHSRHKENRIKLSDRHDIHARRWSIIRHRVQQWMWMLLLVGLQNLLDILIDVIRGLNLYIYGSQTRSV